MTRQDQISEAHEHKFRYSVLQQILYHYKQEILLVLKKNRYLASELNHGRKQIFRSSAVGIIDIFTFSEQCKISVSVYKNCNGMCQCGQVSKRLIDLILIIRASWAIDIVKSYGPFNGDKGSIKNKDQTKIMKYIWYV